MADIEYEGGEAPPNGTYYYPPPPAEDYPPAESECLEKGIVRDHVRTDSTCYMLCINVHKDTITLCSKLLPIDLSRLL